MDVNGTKFHLLFGDSDWTPLIQKPEASEPDLWWTEGGDTLSLRPILFQFPTPPGDKLPRPEDRRGAAADRYGNYYWLDKSESEILILPVGSSKAGASQPLHFWSAADLAETIEEDDGTGAFGPISPPSPTSLQLRGLAVTEHHYLVVGVVDPAGALNF